MIVPQLSKDFNEESASFLTVCMYMFVCVCVCVRARASFFVRNIFIAFHF
jgi:hypothetical protein